MFKRFLVFALLFSIILTGCGAAATAVPEASTGGAAPAYDSARSPASQQAAGEGSFKVAATNPDRLVIKNANLSIYVDDPNASVERVGKMAEDMGGFVVAQNVYQSRLQSGLEVPHASITVRVPAERLTEAMDQIKAETRLPVINETVSSQDVTSEYTDLASQLRNLEAAEKQLQEIMNGATKTEDVISVYSKLTEVRGQIEVIKGQMKYYEESAALSSISVELTASAAQQPLTVAGWQPKGVARDALQALIYGLQGLANVAIWLVLFLLPIGLIIVLFLYLIFKGVRGVLRRLRGAR